MIPSTIDDGSPVPERPRPESGPRRTYRTKLTGREAWRDIPRHLRADIDRELLFYRARYPIDDLMGISLVLDYGDLISDGYYSGRMEAGRMIPPESIRLSYRCRKAVGDLSNRPSAAHIAPRYPLRRELDSMLDGMRGICSEWDEGLLSTFTEDGASDFLRGRFASTDWMTVKDLRPRMARAIEGALASLYPRLDDFALSSVRGFRRGRRFGFREVELP